MRVFVIAAVTFAAIIGTSKVVHLTVAEIVAAWLAWAVLVAVLYGRKLLADDDDYEPEPHERAIPYGADLADSFGAPAGRFWDGYPDERERGRHRADRRLLDRLTRPLAVVWHAPQSLIIGTVWLSRCVRDLLGPAYPGVPQSNFRNVPRPGTWFGGNADHNPTGPGYSDVPARLDQPNAGAVSGPGMVRSETLRQPTILAHETPGPDTYLLPETLLLDEARRRQTYRPPLATYAGLAELAAHDDDTAILVGTVISDDTYIRRLAAPRYETVAAEWPDTHVVGVPPSWVTELRTMPIGDVPGWGNADAMVHLLLADRLAITAGTGAP